MTGGIASGKSVVASRLAELGAVLVDADALARDVVEPGTPGLARVVEAFGQDMLDGAGRLDRARLGAVVFGNDAQRAVLNGIVHPLVREAAAGILATAPEGAVVKSAGFDADVANLFAKELGVNVEFQPLAVANRIPALTTGKVDILFATMAMTEERAKSIQYSKPYAANTISLYAAKSDTVTKPEDVEGWEIGVPKSSS